jgi:AcrR family transcriptional regulator
MPRIEAPTLVEHQELRRAAILDAAVDILAGDGTSALTPAAVASRAGLARSSVYQYFPSTAALLAAGVEETFRRLIDRVQAAMDEATSPGEQVEAYVEASLQAAVAGHEPTGLASADLPEECRAAVAGLHEQVLTPLVRALAAQGKPDPESLAALVHGVVRAAAHQVEHGRAYDAVSHQARSFIGAALEGAHGPPAPKRRS